MFIPELIGYIMPPSLSDLLPWPFIIFCRLPVPRPGQVLGLVGTNGIGKSTALKILAGKMKPNLGKFTVSKIEHLFCHPCRSHFKLWTISSNLTGSPKLGWHSKALSWIRTSEILHSPFGRQNEGSSTVVLVGVLVNWLVHATQYYYYVPNKC